MRSRRSRASGLALGKSAWKGSLGMKGRLRTYSWARGEPMRARVSSFGVPRIVKDLVELVDVVSALEEGTAAEELGEDTADGPDINCVYGLAMSGDGRICEALLLTSFGVALEAQHDLRSTVPSCSDVFGHVASILLRVDRETSGQTKVTDLKLAVGIDQQVSGLQITMQHVSRVDILQTAKDLVDERLEVGIGQGLTGPDNGSQDHIPSILQIC